MAELKKGRVVKMEETFGRLCFVGESEPKTERSRTGGVRTIERNYKLHSEKQSGEIEVKVPGNSPKVAMSFMQEVVLENPAVFAEVRNIGGNQSSHDVVHATAIKVK